MENKEESHCSDELCCWTHTQCRSRKDAPMSKILFYANPRQPSVSRALEQFTYKTYQYTVKAENKILMEQRNSPFYTWGSHGKTPFQTPWISSQSSAYIQENRLPLSWRTEADAGNDYTVWCIFLSSAQKMSLRKTKNHVFILQKHYSTIYHC